MSKPDNRAVCRLGSLAAAMLFGAVTVAGNDVRERPQRGAASCPGSFGSPARLCSACHSIEAGLSHPIDVVPSMAVPSRLPLVDGRITCATCHRTDDSGQPYVPGPPERYRTFCAQCHDSIAATGAALHAVAGSRAHLRWAGRAGNRGVIGRVPEASKGRILDPESVACLTCHDGSLAGGAAGTPAAGARRQLARRMSASHPIGGEQRPRGLGDNLVPPERLDPSIRLFAGRVGCGSCHSPYAGHEALLVMSNRRSRLCLNCHDF